MTSDRGPAPLTPEEQDIASAVWTLVKHHGYSITTSAGSVPPNLVARDIVALLPERAAAERERLGRLEAAARAVVDALPDPLRIGYDGHPVIDALTVRSPQIAALRAALRGGRP
jgi:hypothetical protein